MEIIVEGVGVEYFTPNQVIMNLQFITTGNSYEEVLEIGSRNVQLFVNELLLTNGFTIDDMKTRNFIIKEETKYNEITRTYDFDGYSFNQSALLKFDYDKNRLAIIMEAVSKLTNPPICRINFGIKNEKECRRNILAKAYRDAEDQASSIAFAAGKTLRQCAKVDFKPFTTSYISESSFNGDIMYEKAVCGRVADTITKIFTPEDIELSEKLYCLWIAE